LYAGLLELYPGANTATGGTLAFEQEYLLVTAAARAGRWPEGGQAMAAAQTG
jgi:hypothetical protein